jgi:hypothetical protein
VSHHDEHWILLVNGTIKGDCYMISKEEANPDICVMVGVII